MTANHPLVWYIKWCATITLIIGTAVNSFGYYPQGPIILCVGGILWTIVSGLYRDNALIVTNMTLTLVGIIGLLYNYLYA